MPYKYTVDSKNLPDYILKLSAKLRKIWVDVWNSNFKKHKDEAKAFKAANGVIKKLKSENALFEIHSEFGAVKEIKDLSKEDFESYGVNPSLASYRPNYKIIEGRLFAADIPFCPSTEGITEGYYFILSKDTVEKNLWQLDNMPVHVNTELSGHSEKEGDDNKYIAVGTILGSKMTEVGDENWVDVLCALWDADHPKEVSAISENKAELGMSIEMFFEPDTIEAVDYNLLKVNDVAYKGLAILQKSKAAFPQTQLLVASEYQVNNPVYNIEGEKTMDIKILSDGTVEGTGLEVNGKSIKNIFSVSFSLYQGDIKPYFNYSLIEEEKDGFAVSKSYRLSAEGLEEVLIGKKQVTPLPEKTPVKKQEAKVEGGENIMKYKEIELSQETYTPEEVIEILKSLDAEDERGKVLEAKDVEIKTLNDQIEARKAEDVKLEAKKAEDTKLEAEKTATIEAEKWFEANKDNYLPDNKDEVVGIRAKIDLGSATKDEILKIAELKKQSGTLSAATGETEEATNKKTDSLFGIRTVRK